MAITYVQAKETHATYPGNVTFDSNVTVGNTIFVYILHGYVGCLPSASDNLGNTYTKDQSSTVGGFKLTCWSAPVTTGGACTITLTAACSTYNGGALEYSGVKTSASAFDTSNSNSSTSNPVTCGSITTAENNELVLAYFAQPATLGTFSAFSDGGTSRLTMHNNGSLVEIIKSTAGSINPSATCSQVSGSYVARCGCAAYKAAPAASHSLFRVPAKLNGLGSGGPFFQNPIA